VVVRVRITQCDRRGYPQRSCAIAEGISQVPMTPPSGENNAVVVAVWHSVCRDALTGGRVALRTPAERYPGVLDE
jgi:hypothetical protein